MRDDDHLKWVFDQVSKAISAYNTCKPLPQASAVREAIDTNNVELAKRLCADFGLCSWFPTS